VSLSLWTIYDHPSDHPSAWVARRFDLDAPTDDVLVGDVEVLRHYFQEQGLVCMMRDPSDDPVIVETWL
jgi:hypothetical protein